VVKLKKKQEWTEFLFWQSSSSQPGSSYSKINNAITFSSSIK